ncbi:MAG: TVP38/TMEM64 family protein [Steroidobacteraceae bacterium]
MSKKSARKSNAVWKWAALGVGVVGLFFASRLLPFGEWIEQFTGWIEQKGALGVALFVGGYVLGVLLFFPGLLLTLAAGVAFGLWGIPVALGSATVGAALAFLVARYLARGAIEKRAKKYERFAAIDEAVGENGWKIVGLLRLSPLVPFNLANYFFGLTQVEFWPYVLASFTGMAPGSILYVYLGHVGKATLAGGGDKQYATQEWVLLGIGLIATAAVTVYLTILAKKALKKTGSSRVRKAEK